MPRVVFTAHLVQQAGGAEFVVPGATVREVLDNLFQTRPLLRSYLLDDQGGLRHHVMAFINGAVVRDKQRLDEPIPAEGELYILQALSGG